MEKVDLVVKLIYLPYQYNNGDVSISNLLKESGYYQMHENVSENKIRNELVKHPECVDDWILYSDDKRTTSGYYLKQIDEKKYVVGFFDENDQQDIETEYTNKISACAAFIKKELEQIRLSN